MRYRFLAAAAVLCLCGGLASAQPRMPEPAVEVRLRSVNDLVDKFEFVAGLAGKEDAVAQVRELIRVLSADGKGIDGVDPKRPIGAYAVLEKDIATSPVVVMVPIADEETFLTQLKARYGLTPEKGEGGTHKVPVQNVPGVEAVHLRFANGYVYAARAVKDLNPNGLIPPKAFFARDDGSVVSLLVRIDRIPAELRTFVFGRLEHALSEERKKNADNENAAEAKMKALVLDALLAGAKGLSDDGKEFAVRVFADAKADALSAEVTLTARGGSPTAKNFAALGRQTSLPRGIVGTAADRVGVAGVKVAVTDGMKKDYSAAIDALLADAVKNAPADQEEVVKQLVAAVSPTLKAGELDAAATLVGPDAKGRYQFVGALAVRDGKGIEKFAKKTVEDYGQFIEGFVTFKFDVEKVGEFNLHRIDLKEADEKFEKLFGTKTLWLATSDDCIALSIEPDGATIRKGLKAKAAPAPIVVAEVDVAKLLPLVRPDLQPDELKALLKDAFGDGPTGDKGAASLTISTGDDKLTIKVQAKGKVVRLGAGLELLKGK